MEPRGAMAEDVFPVERPPPQDPGLVDEVKRWLFDQARAVGRGAQRTGMQMPETLKTEIEGGAAETQAGLAHTAQGARDYARSPITERGIPNVRGMAGGAAKTALGAGRLAGAGATTLGRMATELPVAVGEEVTGQPRSAGVETARQIVEPFVTAPIPLALGTSPLARSLVRGAASSPHLRNDAGYVYLERSPRTGLPTGMRGGPGPPQRALPPGETEAPAVISADLSGKPGGPIHVDYFRGEETTPHAARGAALGTSAGGGMRAGKEVMDELVHHAKEGGYTGVDFWAVASDATPAERAAARREGTSHLPSIRNEGRLRLNESYIGNKAVPRGGGHEIPLPREDKMPPKPPWFQSEEPPTDVQRAQWSPVRSPAEAQRHWERRLEESDFLAQEMQRLRRERVDPIDARRQAEDLLEERRSGGGGPGPSTGPSRADSIAALHTAILQRHPEATISRGTLTSLVDDYRQTVGVTPSDVDDLRDYAIRAGHIDRAAMDRMLGPAATTGSAPPGLRGSAATAQGNAQDASNLLESYRRQFQAQQGRNVGTFDELRQFAIDQGYVSPQAFDDTWTMAYGGGSLPTPRTTEAGLRRGGMPSQPVRAPRTPAQQASSREAALARREAETAARIEARARHREPTASEQALLRRVEERRGAGMARETEQETRRALRAAGQTEMFRGTEPTRAARAEPRVRIGPSRANPRRGGFEPDPAETARQGYPVEPGGARDLANERGAMLNRAQTQENLAQRAYETDDRAHFDRALAYMQQQATRLGRSLTPEEIGQFIEQTRNVPRGGGRLDIGPPDLSTEAGRISAREEYLAGEVNLRPDQLEELYPSESMRQAAMRVRERRAGRRAFQPDAEEQARRTLERDAERGSGAEPRWDAPDVRDNYNAFRLYYGRDPRTPWEVMEYVQASRRGETPSAMP